MKKCLLTLAVSSALLTSMTQVQAAGFQLAEYSATGLGRAFAGEAAMADNASAQARNPALLALLPGRQVSTGGIYVSTEVDVTGDVHLSSPLLGPDGMTLPADAFDVADSAFIPNFYYSSQIDGNWSWGLAMNSNYGLATELPKTHSAAIFGNETSVTTVELAPNLAYRLNEQLALGAGVRLVYGEGSIGASTPAWVGAIKANPMLPAQIAARLPDPGTSLKTMEGDDLGYGWQLGATWQPSLNHRFGLAYHSGVELELSGSASGLLYTGGQPLEIDGYLPLELPAFAELSSFHQLSDALALHASINWTQWSSFDRLVAYFPGDTKPVGGLESDLVKEENFKDNWRYALGASYVLDQQWTLRVGVALDQTAVDDEWRTTTIPDSDRLWFSLGASYQLDDKLTLDLALTHLRAHGDAPITEQQDLAGLALVEFDGEAGGKVWLAGFQLSYKL
ncbi:outer membrane protein transport protein [Shewanella sedimentimangrovi]|uniref:Outer membrane protein transport protein n=1 Tax=Shewanella sedimentimangrovi TaxID=2814293 RepID=A0ABX7R3C3_9GAMM|nr:outer membrane protein transport protein [Shewanella sedimentimangrovi]QSX37588.1 outer membrane protein transport protein [Shewanella sedimentimangrovi]